MSRVGYIIRKGIMMRKIIAVIMGAVVLALSACAADEAMPGMALAEDQASANAVVVMGDEAVPLAESINFDEKSNQVASIPTHVGGGMQLKIDGDLYDICYSYGELVLEKDGLVYELWDAGLTGIVETAAGKTLKELCAYSVKMDGKEFTVDGWTRKTIFDILSAVYNSPPIDGFNKQGECARFSNELGADFELYLEDDIIYSPYLDACFDISAYHDDFISFLK